MPKRAPPGARQSAQDVMKLRRIYGAKTAAKMLGVSKSTLYRVSGAAKKRTAIGAVISSRQSADKWRSRVDVAHSTASKGLLTSLQATRPKDIAKGLTDAGIPTTYQQVTWWQRKAGVTKWTRRKDVVKPLSPFSARVLSTELQEHGRILVGDVWVYQSAAFLPEGGERIKTFMELEEALWWMKLIGAGSVYFTIYKEPDRPDGETGGYSIAHYEDSSDYVMSEQEKRIAWDEVDEV